MKRDERLLWSGKPKPGIRLRAIDIFLIPFSLLWAGFASFWEYMVIKESAPAVFPLFGVPFVLVGLYMVFGRFWYDSVKRGRTFYGVTNRRVVIVSRMFGRNVTSLALNTISDVRLTQGKDGSGTIAFGPSPSFGMWSGFNRFTATWGPCLDMIPEAKHVYDIILEARNPADR